MGADAQSVGQKGKLWNFNYIYLLSVYAITGTAFQMMTPIIRFRLAERLSCRITGTMPQIRTTAATNATVEITDSTIPIA